MQYILLVPLLIMMSSLGFGQTKTTIANGDYHDPNIWSPVGVPNLINTDSLFIAHQLSFSQKLIINWNYFELENNACLNSVSGLDTISFIDVNGSMKIKGDLHVGWFNNQCSNSEISGKVIAETQFNNLDTITLTSSAFIETYKWYCAAGVSFEAELLCSYFNNNGGFISGDGKVCVLDTLRNQGTVEGTVDLCDATPNGSGDYNIGTYGSSVTFCTASPCTPISISCQSNGIDSFGRNELKIYPNPSNGFIHVEELNKGTQYVIYNMQGKIVKSGFSSSRTLSISEFESGVYILSIKELNAFARIIVDSNY